MADEIEDLAAVRAVVAQIAAHALAEVVRFADVEQAAVLAGKAVYARRRRQRRDPRAWQQADETPPIAGAMLEVEQIAEAAHAVAAQQLAEVEEDLHRHARVAEGPVAIDDRDAEM